VAAARLVRAKARVRARVRVRVRVRVKARVAAARLPVGLVACEPLACGILQEECTKARLVRTQRAVDRLVVAALAAEGVGVMLAPGWGWGSGWGWGWG
jgi:hypothetical protein